MTTNTALVIGLAVLPLAVALVAGVRQAYRNHWTLVELEKQYGNKDLRTRMRRDVTTRGRGPVVETTAPAEHLNGWVWIKVEARAPRSRGEDRRECFTERVVYAPTRRGLTRKQEQLAERGEVESILLLVFGLIVASAVLSQVGDQWSAGDVLDWLIAKAQQALSALFS